MEVEDIVKRFLFSNERGYHSDELPGTVLLVQGDEYRVWQRCKGRDAFFSGLLTECKQIDEWQGGHYDTRRVDRHYGHQAVGKVFRSRPGKLIQEFTVCVVPNY